MRNGKNVWVSFYGGEKVKSDVKPTNRGDDFFVAAYPASRITSRGYVAYDGNTEWERAANKQMANAVR